MQLPRSNAADHRRRAARLLARPRPRVLARRRPVMKSGRSVCQPFFAPNQRRRRRRRPERAPRVRSAAEPALAVTPLRLRRLCALRLLRASNGDLSPPASTRRRAPPPSARPPFLCALARWRTSTAPTVVGEEVPTPARASATRVRQPRRIGVFRGLRDHAAAEPLRRAAVWRARFSPSSSSAGASSMSFAALRGAGDAAGSPSTRCACCSAASRPAARQFGTSRSPTPRMSSPRRIPASRSPPPSRAPRRPGRRGDPLARRRRRCALAGLFLPGRPHGARGAGDAAAAAARSARAGSADERLLARRREERTAARRRCTATGRRRRGARRSPRFATGARGGRRRRGRCSASPTTASCFGCRSRQPDPARRVDARRRARLRHPVHRRRRGDARQRAPLAPRERAPAWPRRSSCARSRSLTPLATLVGAIALVLLPLAPRARGQPTAVFVARHLGGARRGRRRLATINSISRAGASSAGAGRRALRRRGRRRGGGHDARARRRRRRRRDSQPHLCTARRGRPPRGEVGRGVAAGGGGAVNVIL